MNERDYWAIANYYFRMKTQCGTLYCWGDPSNKDIARQAFEKNGYKVKFMEDKNLGQGLKFNKLELEAQK